LNATVTALRFDELAEGLESSLAVAVSPAAVARFVELSGDVGPLHTSDDFAASRGFHGRVVHGAYLAALVSRLVGTQLPGANAVIQQIQLTFHKPTYIGDAVIVVGRVVRKLEPLRAILISVDIESSGAAGESRRVASGKVQVGLTA
jgi:acyl dehydratase